MTPKPVPASRLTVVIANQVYRRLKLKLLKQGKTISWFIRDAIARFLDE